MGTTPPPRSSGSRSQLPQPARFLFLSRNPPPPAPKGLAPRRKERQGNRFLKNQNPQKKLKDQQQMHLKQEQAAKKREGGGGGGQEQQPVSDQRPAWGRGGGMSEGEGGCISAACNALSCLLLGFVQVLRLGWQNNRGEINTSSPFGFLPTSPPPGEQGLLALAPRKRGHCLSGALQSPCCFHQPQEPTHTQSLPYKGLFGPGPDLVE